MGFWLDCVAVAGLFVQSLSGKISITIKSNQNSYHLQYKDKNAIAPRKIRFFSKIGYHFSDYQKRINVLISRFLLSFSLCYTTLAATKANKMRGKRTYDSLMKVS